MTGQISPFGVLPGDGVPRNRSAERWPGRTYRVRAVDPSFFSRPRVTLGKPAIQNGYQYQLIAFRFC